MPDEKGTKVEKYKLSEEQLEFAKKFKRMQKVRKLLEERVIKLNMESAKIQEIFKQLDEEAQALDVPKETLRNFPDQDFASESEKEDFINSIMYK